MVTESAIKNKCINMIGEDIRLSKLLFEKAKQHTELEAITQNISITTLRYIPSHISREAIKKCI